MATIDLTPLYRSSVGYDRLGSLLDSAFRNESVGGYPPYDIEVRDENRYAVTLAVAGFKRDELDINVERGVLSVRGKKSDDREARTYLYQGIANRSFERKFNLAEHVEVTGAELNDGLLTVTLVKEIPEAMKPKSIPISDSSKIIEHGKSTGKAA